MCQKVKTGWQRETRAICCRITVELLRIWMVTRQLQVYPKCHLQTQWLRWEATQPEYQENRNLCSQPIPQYLRTTATQVRESGNADNLKGQDS